MNNQYETFPEFKPKDFSFVCDNGWRYSSADIVFSSAGFATITAAKNDGIRIRAYTPDGRGIVLRRPSLMPYAVNWRGKMKKNLKGHYKGFISRQTKKQQFHLLQPYKPLVTD